MNDTLLREGPHRYQLKTGPAFGPDAPPFPHESVQADLTNWGAWRAAHPDTDPILQSRPTVVRATDASPIAQERGHLPGGGGPREADAVLGGIAAFARPLAKCPQDGLWRGMLDLALTAYRQAEELVRVAEARLDAEGKAGERVRLLDTVPGLGPRSGEAVVADPDDSKRFQSGEDDRRADYQAGSAVLRELLVQCAWAMPRYNPWERAVYDRLGRGRAWKEQAVVAHARKVLVRCWALLRDGAARRPDPKPVTAVT